MWNRISSDYIDTSKFSTEKSFSDLVIYSERELDLVAESELDYHKIIVPTHIVGRNYILK